MLLTSRPSQIVTCIRGGRICARKRIERVDVGEDGNGRFNGAVGEGKRLNGKDLLQLRHFPISWAQYVKLP